MKTIQLPRRFVQESWGGTETVILETSKRMRTLGHPTEIFCPDIMTSRHHDDVQGVPVRRFPYFYPYLGLPRDARTRLDQKGGNLFSFALMRALWREPDIDLIHLHTQKRLGGIARYVAQQRDLPYVVSLHGGLLDVPDEEARSWTAPTRGAYEWGRALGWWVGARRVLEDANAILCVGQREQQEVARQFPDKRVEYLPNGVDPERFIGGDGDAFRRRHGIAASARLLLTVGRIDPQKNQLLALEALQTLLPRFPDLHLALVGSVTHDAYAAELRQQIHRRELETRVTVLDRTLPGREIVDAYDAAELFLLPSTHEPFGIVALEAWAAGRAVVASRVGGIPYFIEDGVNGALFESKNVEQAAAQIAAVLSDHGRRQTLAEAGQGLARTEYSWDHQTRRLIDTYDDIIRSHHRRHAAAA